MNKKSLLVIAAVFFFANCFSQDKVIKANNEEVLGKVILFQNGKFTLLLPDKSELTLPKDGVKEIQFDTSKCAAFPVVIKSGKEEDMDTDCDNKNVGNCVFINKTGVDITLLIYKQEAERDGKAFQLSKAEDPVKYYGLESGSYIWKTINGFYTSGGLFIPKCKTAATVTIK